MPQTASLEFLPVVVIAMGSPTPEPAIAAAFIPESPVGPCVGVGVACSMPGAPGLAFVAHLHPDECDSLIDRLTLARDAARAALGGGDFQIPANVADAAMEGYANNPGGAAIVASVLDKDGERHAAAFPQGDFQPQLMAGEAMGLQIQVQHEGEGPPSYLPGSVGFICHPVPGAEPPRAVLGLHIRHGDGSGLAGLLEMEQLDPFLSLLENAGEEFKALRQGAPKGQIN